jgi:hypothetical protein
MENRVSYLVAYVYTVAVIITGIAIAEAQIPDLTPFRIAAMLVLGAVWSVYFGYRVGPRIVDLETEDEEEDGEGRNGGDGGGDSQRLDPTQA